jgi:hypothetical protein
MAAVAFKPDSGATMLISGMVSQHADAIIEALQSVADPSRSAAMRAYMRDQFEFLGVGTPQRRAATKFLYASMKPWGPEELIDAARATWELNEREYQYAAIDLLAMHYDKFDPRHLPFLMELVQSRSWWDTVDALASVIGKVYALGTTAWIRRLHTRICGCGGSRCYTSWDGAIKPIEIGCFPTR